jgi:hypothetical protein
LAHAIDAKAILTHTWPARVPLATRL